MAKWGEGDPRCWITLVKLVEFEIFNDFFRWIVEDRPDGTNVNNWHWTEKNADSWSKNKIKVELLGAKFVKDQNCSHHYLKTVHI